MKLGRLRGMNIKVNGCCFLLLLVCSLSGMVAEAVIVFFSIVLHELAHVVVAMACGYRVTEVEILPFGGLAKIERFWERARRKIFFTSLSGPLVSLITGTIFFWSFSPDGYYRTAAEFNLILGLFNLVPAFPLDGGNIMRVVLLNFGTYRQATQWTVASSIFFIAVLAIKVIADLVSNGEIHLSLLILLGFIGEAVRAELKHSRFYMVKLMAYKKADLLCSGVMELCHCVVVKDTKIKGVTERFAAEKYTIVVVLDEMYRICGMFTEIELWEAIGERGIGATFRDLLH